MTKNYKRSYKDVYNACRNAIINLGCTDTHFIYDKGYMEGITGRSFLSFGEMIQICLERKDGCIKVDASSSFIKTQLLFNTRNKRNERDIFRMLDKFLRVELLEKRKIKFDRFNNE